MVLLRQEQSDAKRPVALRMNSESPAPSPSLVRKGGNRTCQVSSRREQGRLHDRPLAPGLSLARFRIMGSLSESSKHSDPIWHVLVNKVSLTKKAQPGAQIFAL